MFFAWLIILLIYGSINSWAIPALAWWLLVPFGIQDLYDRLSR